MTLYEQQSRKVLAELQVCVRWCVSAGDDDGDDDGDDARESKGCQNM